MKLVLGGKIFPKPLFEGRFCLIEQRLVGDKHLKMTLGLQETHKQLVRDCI